MLRQFLAGLVVASLGAALAAQQPVNQDAPRVPAVLAGKPGQEKAAVAPSPISASSLHGYWAGVGYLDVELLDKKLAGMKDEEARKKLAAQADAFLSMVAVVGFQANGKWESELELSGPDGKSVREGVRGTWKIVESRPDRFLVEILELRADKTTETVRKMFQFYEDGQHIATPIETSPDLAELNPLIVFERIPAEAVAENMDPTSAKKDR